VQGIARLDPAIALDLINPKEVLLPKIGFPAAVRAFLFVGCLRVRFGQHSAHGPEDCNGGRGETVALTDHTDDQQYVQGTELDITD